MVPIDSKAVANVPMELAREADRRDAAVGARHELMLILDGFGFIEEGGLELDSFTGCARCKGGAASMGLETSSAGRDGLERPSGCATEGPGEVDKVLEVFSAALDELDSSS